MKNKWQRFREFINSVPEEEIITRKLLLAVVGERKRHGVTTTDSYRRMCELAGYLQKGDEPGLYIKVKDIPEGALKNDIKEEAYGYRNFDNRFPRLDLDNGTLELEDDGTVYDLALW